MPSNLRDCEQNTGKLSFPEVGLSTFHKCRLAGISPNCPIIRCYKPNFIYCRKASPGVENIPQRPTLFSAFSKRNLGFLNTNFRLFPTVRASSVAQETATKEPAPTSDKDDSNSSQPAKISYEPPEGQTGWDRLLDMYTMDTYGGVGPEWMLIKQGFYSSMIAGAIIGMFVGAKEAQILHLDKSKATLYLNEMAARRALTDKMTLGMFRGAMKWGWRTTLFTTIYLTTLTHLTVYKGKTSVLDFAFSGALTASAYKFMQGPIASLTAGAVGAGLGLVSGALSLGVISLFGYSIEQIRYEYYNMQPKYMKGEVYDGFVMSRPPPASYKDDTNIVAPTTTTKSTTITTESTTTKS